MMKKIQSLVVGDLDKPLRLDRLVHELFDVPWSRARKWIGDGKISVDGQLRTAPEVLISSGQSLEYKEDAPKPKRPGHLDAESILFVDSHVLVAIKPSGILTVPFDKGDKGTFDQKIRSYLAKTGPRPVKKRGAMSPLMIVHRLDRGASGVLVFARTWTAKKGLASQFRQHSPTRQYLALVHGHAASGAIETHLLKDRGDGLRGSSESSPHAKVRRLGEGRWALTHVECLQKLDGASLISCRLETGRTNQIRIHLSEQGHPLLGETTYMRGFKGIRIQAERLMLHAKTLGFVHPVTNQEMSFEAPLPPEFDRFIKNLSRSM